MSTVQPSSKFRKAAVLAFQDIQAIQKVLKEFDVNCEIPDNSSKLNFSSFSRIPNSARSTQNSIDSISTKSMLEENEIFDSAPRNNFYEASLPFESPFNLTDSNKYQIASSNPPSLNSLSRLEFPLSDKIETRKQKSLETDPSQSILFSRFENKSPDTSKLNIDNSTEKGDNNKNQKSFIPQNIFIKSSTTPNTDAIEFSTFYNTSNENKDEILKRAREDFETLLKSQRKVSFENFKNMLKIGSEAYLKEKELEFERNTLPKDPATIARNLVDFIVRRAAEIFHSESSQFSENDANNIIQNQSFQNTSVNYTTTNSTTTTIQHDRKDTNKNHINPANTYFQNYNHHQNDLHEDNECDLPQHLQMKITQNLVEQKQQLLTELESLLHQEARSALHDTQRKIRARKKYWVDLTNKDKQAAHQLRLQELQLELKFPVSNFSHQYQYSPQSTSSTNSHTDWGDNANNTYHSTNNINEVVEEEEDDDDEREEVRGRIGLTRTRLTPGPGPAHAQSKTLGNINGRVYLDRARRGNEAILMNLEHSLENILETSYPSYQSGYTQQTSTRFNSTLLTPLQEGDNDEEVLMYANNEPDSILLTHPSSGNMTAIRDLIYEKVSSTRHLMLQIELRLQKQQTLHHRLTVEAEALKNISSKETLRLLNETFENLK